jgi:hypothetical protein
LVLCVGCGLILILPVLLTRPALSVALYVNVSVAAMFVFEFGVYIVVLPFILLRFPSDGLETIENPKVPFALGWVLDVIIDYGLQGALNIKISSDRTLLIPLALLISEKKVYGQVPGCEVLVELVEPVTAVPELEEQLDCAPPALLDDTDWTPPW